MKPLLAIGVDRSLAVIDSRVTLIRLGLGHIGKDSAALLEEAVEAHESSNPLRVL